MKYCVVEAPMQNVTIRTAVGSKSDISSGLLGPTNTFRCNVHTEILAKSYLNIDHSSLPSKCSKYYHFSADNGRVSLNVTDDGCLLKVEKAKPADNGDWKIWSGVVEEKFGMIRYKTTYNVMIVGMYITILYLV